MWAPNDPAYEYIINLGPFWSDARPHCTGSKKLRLAIGMITAIKMVEN